MLGEGAYCHVAVGNALWGNVLPFLRYGLADIHKFMKVADAFDEPSHVLESHPARPEEKGSSLMDPTNLSLIYRSNV